MNGRARGRTASPADDTPLMQQWREIKARHRDALLLFRVGDFYEMFYGDAEEGARLLGLTLTSRNNGAAGDVPLAGIPTRALDEYLARLVRLGRRVAICEQVEDPSEAKGLVRREVVETVTPGAVLHDALLRAERNNFLVAIAPPRNGAYALAAVDLSTGELLVEEVPEHELAAELGRLEPSELLLARCLADGEGPPQRAEAAEAMSAALRTVRDDWLFDGALAAAELCRHFCVHNLDGFGFAAGDDALIGAAGALLAYLREVQPAAVSHLRPPRIERTGSAMVLDDMTRRNLELVEPLRAGEEGGTLLSVLDETVTPMGARLLRRWLLRPVVDAPTLWRRHDAVAELLENRELRRALRRELRAVGDLERLAAKVGAARISPRELAALGRSLSILPRLCEMFAAAESELLRELMGSLDPLDDVRALVERALVPDPPVTLAEGGVIRQGYDAELDELRQVRDGARDFIAGLEARERRRTEIQSLKVGYNKVFGYYLEVTRPNLGRVPPDYVRKQTLVNAERFFTPELKEWEEKVLGAEDRIAGLEARLFAGLRARVADHVARLQDAGSRVATQDVLACLAEVAERRRYVRPEVHTGYRLEIRGGRHPVVETMMPREEFIPNDVMLDEDRRTMILTGPNMAGKSTILRQVGLIQLMAQIGSFVPADAAKLAVCDRIFTRVGASDNLVRGRSTFMVEMNETAAIIHGATPRSLVLLDEIGRGTSTYDGVSIAWAVTEHLHDHLGAKTIFATHYHELTQLGDLLDAAFNLNVAVKEVGEDIVFLRHLEPGGADRSYGIHVARLAGLPPDVIARAGEILEELQGSHTGGGEGLGRRGPHRPRSVPAPDQLSLFAPEHPVVRALQELDVERMTPLEALKLLAELRCRAGGRASG
ncbi:MAG: DNA mismatch repair protein MutS [Gemmatimonadetes bacterium]|nr:DNA mismatch repair protein MutS [Gemmatimonadota bacterium]